MISGSEFEKLILKYNLNSSEYHEKIEPDFFENRQIRFVFEYTKKFYRKYSKLPNKSQLFLLLKVDKTPVTQSDLDAIWETDISEYDPEWLKESTQSWILWKGLTNSLIDAVEYTKTVKATPENIRNIIDSVKSIINTKNQTVFDSGLGLDFWDFDSHKPGKHEKITTTHNWIDQFVGGYRPGTLNVYAGLANVGKSIFLANDAIRYVIAGKNVSVISAEMSEYDYLQRIASNALGIPVSEYEKTVSEDPNLIKRKLETLDMGIIPPGKLWIKEVETSNFSVNDIENYCLRLEEKTGQHLDVIVLDYINILLNSRNPNSENTYIKIKQLAEDLRAVARRNRWIIITATQLGRGAFETTDLSMSSVAESMGLNHTADIMYAIIQDEMMHINNEYWLKLIKTRNGAGKNKKCRYEIDYRYMKLTETENIID